MLLLRGHQVRVEVLDRLFDHLILFGLIDIPLDACDSSCSRRACEKAEIAEFVGRGGLILDLLDCR